MKDIAVSLSTLAMAVVVGYGIQAAAWLESRVVGPLPEEPDLEWESFETRQVA